MRTNQYLKEMIKKEKQKDDWKNKLYYGDNLDIMRKYIRDETIDLCYIDPPFNSKRNYNQIYMNVGHEDTAQAQAFVDTWTWSSRSNRELTQLYCNEHALYTAQTIKLIQGFESVLGKGSMLSYIISMTLRIAEIQRVLKKTGSFYLHCDPTASHYLKLVCDSVFCSKGGDFKNEIIWSYKRYTAVSNRFQRLHDSILFYSKTDKILFNELREEYGDKSGKMDSHYKQDEKGKWYRMQKRKGKDPYIIYLSEGKRTGDVWEIPIINASAKERLGYPTQKPEGLLERIINASTNKGDVILDAYCGCGTTVAVAQHLKRKWIGIDITYHSVSLMLKRLEDSFGEKIKDNIELNGVPKDFESAIALANKEDDRVRKEFEKWTVLAYSNNRAVINEKKGKDFGIDGIAFISDRVDGDIKQLPIIFSVKSDKHPKPAYVRDLIGVMLREKAVMGYLIILYDPTKDMIDEAHKQGKYNNSLFEMEFSKVKIITVKEILSGKQWGLPSNITIEVLKSAKKKQDKGEQMKLEIEN